MLLVGPTGVEKSHIAKALGTRAFRAGHSTIDVSAHRMSSDLRATRADRARYERGAMIVTSNRAREEWYPLFRDDLLASDAMDRLLHHAHHVELDGDSYRSPPDGRRRDDVSARGGTPQGMGMP